MGKNLEGSGPVVNEIWSRHILAFSWSYWQKSRKYSSPDSRVRITPGPPRYEAELPSSTQQILETYQVWNLNKNWNRNNSTKFGKLEEFPSLFTDIRLQLQSSSFHIYCNSAATVSFLITVLQRESEIAVKVGEVSFCESHPFYLYNHTLTEDTFICISTIIY
jgi:hypothetical protein